MKVATIASAGLATLMLIGCGTAPSSSDRVHSAPIVVQAGGMAGVTQPELPADQPSRASNPAVRPVTSQPVTAPRPQAPAQSAAPSGSVPSAATCSQANPPGKKIMLPACSPG